MVHGLVGRSQACGLGCGGGNRAWLTGHCQQEAPFSAVTAGPRWDRLGPVRETLLQDPAEQQSPGLRTRRCITLWG